MSGLSLPQKTRPLAAQHLLRASPSLCAIVLICFLTSCAAPAEPVVSNVTEWHLDADIDSDQPATLSRGISMDEVSALLGRPNRVWKRKGNESHIETWTYRRMVNGPSKPFTIRNGNRLIRGTQPIRYVDTVVILFSNNALQSADVSRETERNSPGSWEHMK